MPSSSSTSDVSSPPVTPSDREDYMDLGCYSFSALDTLIEETHLLFDERLSKRKTLPDVDGDLWLRLKLAVHEWMANLVQHADFDGSAQRVTLALGFDGQRFHCAIEDNSAGFDLTTQVLSQQTNLESCPERGMGLLMLQALSEDIKYLRSDNGICRIEFVVSASQDSWLNIQF
jgi:serine/threonine-protein kinase RsbW